MDSFDEGEGEAETKGRFLRSFFSGVCKETKSSCWAPPVSIGPGAIQTCHQTKSSKSETVNNRNRDLRVFL